MRTSYFLLLTSSFAVFAQAQTAQLRWDVQQDRPVAHDVQVWQGETVDLMPRLVQGTAPVAVTNAPVEFRYRETALPTNTYRYVPASADTNSGVLAVRWIPDYDAGAAWYDYQFIVGSNAANPRAFGRITMRPTIGWPASANPPPPVTLYPSRADLQAVSNALAEAVQAESETNALFNAWFGSLFNSTSRWDAAYGWGDWHSAVALKLDITSTNGWETGSHAAFLTAESDPVALAALAEHAAYWPPDATASSWFTFVTNSGAITITGRAAALDAAITIPDYINGLPVTALAATAFDFASFTSVDCGNSLSQIGYGAFLNCDNMTVFHARNVSQIGLFAFESCDTLNAVYFSGDAPAAGADIYLAINPGQVTNYVTNPTATGWGDRLGGMPVVRLPLYADALTLGGVTHTNWPSADVSGLATTNSPTILNPTVHGWIALPQSAPTNLVLRLVCSNEHIIVQEVYQ